MKQIHSAGIITYTIDNDTILYLLLRYSAGHWDLPKGKLDDDETPEQAAVREVEEECGITNLSIIRKLPITFHTYMLKEKRMLKKNHWFLMHTSSNAPLVPQEEEGIEEVRWMNKTEIQTRVLKNTYASISDLLNQFFGRS